jgi:hypothetical protein
MGLHRGRTPSAQIEALNLYALLHDARQGEVGGPDDLAAFIKAVESGLTQSLANPRRLHGRWAQDLFRAVLISLDAITMIKDEDAGEFHSREPLRLPDFRVVTRAGEHLLIEVKNVGPARIPRPQKLRAKDVAAQRRYAEITGARLLFAHYWAAVNLWTLADSAVLQPRDAYFVMDPSDALSANELGTLGDRVIMTTSTLALSLSAEDGPAGDIDPEFAALPLPFKATAAVFTCDGNPLTDPAERAIARALFLYGGGEARFAMDVDEHGEPLAMTITWSSHAGSGTPIVGSYLSQIFTGRYAAETKRPDGSVARIRHEPDPSLTRLIPPGHASPPGAALPLTVARQRPRGTVSTTPELTCGHVETHEHAPAADADKECPLSQ